MGFGPRIINLTTLPLGQLDLPTGIQTMGDLVKEAFILNELIPLLLP